MIWTPSVWMNVAGEKERLTECMRDKIRIRDQVSTGRGSTMPWQQVLNCDVDHKSRLVPVMGYDTHVSMEGQSQYHQHAHLGGESLEFSYATAIHWHIKTNILDTVTMSGLLVGMTSALSQGPCVHAPTWVGMSLANDVSKGTGGSSSIGKQSYQ